MERHQILTSHLRAYIQAYGILNNLILYKKSTIFDVHPDFTLMRKILSNVSPNIKQELNYMDSIGKTGEVEKKLIKGTIKQSFKIDDNFIDTLEDSLAAFNSNENNMVSYETVFAFGTNYLINTVAKTLELMNDRIPLKERVFTIVDDILFKNYWQGDDIKRSIEDIRYLNSHLKLSEVWIKEFALKSFTPIL